MSSSSKGVDAPKSANFRFPSVPMRMFAPYTKPTRVSVEATLHCPYHHTLSYLDIPVDDMVAMQVVEALEDLIGELAYHCFVEAAVKLLDHAHQGVLR